MKPIYLEFCGVNSFSEKAVVDFRKLFTSGIFGIFGDTGSGKSTILDCIQLAIYGTIDRSSEAECINKKSDGFYIVYDFELSTDGVRKTYRVRRERTKKASNNTKAFLYEGLGDDRWLALAEGTRDVNQRLSELVGLSLADFKICIALPQGEFAGLVKAKPADRLALVARLFDLTKYGDRLKFYLRDKCGAASLAFELSKSKLENLEDCGEARQASVEQGLSALKAQLATTEEKAAATETSLAQAEAALKEKLEYERAKTELEKAERELPAYVEKRAILERYSTLKGLSDKNAEISRKRRERANAKSEKDRAEGRSEVSKSRWETTRIELENAKFDEKIEELSRILGRFETAKEEIKQRDELKRALDESRAEYAAIKNAVAFEPFDERLLEIEKELERLDGSTSVVDYVKNHLKDEILAKGYGQVRDDFEFIGEKYPQTREDVMRFIEKYSFETTGDSFDLTTAQTEFKAIEERRKRLKAESETIEKRKKAYEENESKKRSIEEKGKHLRESYSIAEGKIAALEKDGKRDELDELLAEFKEAKKRAEGKVSFALEEFTRRSAEAEKYAALEKKYDEEANELLSELEKGLAAEGFSEIGEADSLLLGIGEERSARRACDEFFTNYGSWKTYVERTDKARFENASEEGTSALKDEKRRLEDEKKRLGIEIGKTERELQKLLETREKFKEYEKDFSEKKKTYELWEKLRACVSGRRSDKTLMDFVATEYLQDVCVSAGKTLANLTNGRYVLHYEGGEFYVRDNLDGGNLRAVKTLSGGETFLVSLSLALSLSAAICQKSRRPVEFFFLDEGFGTLDEKLVDVVMDVLGKLSKEFTIGLISHVEELKRRIDNKILVTGANELHGSQIRLEHF